MKNRDLLIIVIFFVILFLSFDLVSASSVGLIENSIWQRNLTGVSGSSSAFGDIDNDGDLDMFLSGDGIGGVLFAKIYINNGTTLIENQTWQQNLSEMSLGSISWTDIDNDGDLDLALIGDEDLDTVAGRIAKIYINNGTTLQENTTWQQNLTGASDTSIISGDYNNIGLNSIIIGLPKTRTYINNGTTLIENNQWQSNIQEAFSSGIGVGGITDGALNFGDYDNDGDLDLFATGHDGGDPRNKLFENNGTTFYIKYNWQDNLIGGVVGGVHDSSNIFGDIDNDGDLDLALIGSWLGLHAKIFINNGTQLISNYSWFKNLEEIKDGSIAFGDYDNDGDLDLAWSGYNGSMISKIYENNGSTFLLDTIASTNLTNVEYSSLVWIDIDSDNDLDLALSGLSTINPETFISKIYINNDTVSNTQPNAPTGFNSSSTSEQIILNWSQGSDTETNVNGLYYNLRLGTSSGGNQIVSGIYGGSSNPTAGYFGNMMQRRRITLTGSWLQTNTTYYWNVQTIDTALKASSWSTEQNFTTGSDVTNPNITLNSPDDGNYTASIEIIFNASVFDNENLTNVSLYGNWSGWHLNETNSSGINNSNYIFTKNMSGEGIYQWKIKACDNSSNCINSSSRTFIVDLYSPKVYLENPSNGSTWSSSSTVTFSYNVSDIAIANCSLIINNVIDQNDTSITVNSTQEFTKSLSNANYNWSVNCTDNLNRKNNSETWQLTVSYSSGNGGGPGGGGGGGSGSTIITTEYVCGNGICESESGETFFNCPSDCIYIPSEVEGEEVEEVPEKNVSEEPEIEEERPEKKFDWWFLLLIAGLIVVSVGLIVLVLNLKRKGKGGRK